MKKVAILAAAVAVWGITSLDANAQASTQQAPAEQQGQEAKKEKVTKDQLPAPVQAALKSDTYKDWTIGDIYKVAPAEGGKAVYEVAMTNAQGQTGIVKMDEKGGDASATSEK